MQEVVRKGIVKLLDTGIIYPIADSPWVSPIHRVPKKEGSTVVTNENDELVLTITVTGWQVCSDYHKLNEATAKDQFPLPFIDQMRMPFGLCNAPATFQRCMLAIFHDMIEESVEEQCHFMVKKGIVLGHKVSGAGLEVDKAKINLLEKDTPFKFNDECQKAFKILKEKLTCAPVIITPNWNLPFELMCDASNFAVGAVLEFDIEIKDKKGIENVAADHLSQIEKDESRNDDSEVDDNFPGETLMGINTKNEPWFADFTNYLVADIIPKGMTYQQKNKFFSDFKYYF
ncbi:reverse transcriptase domain-containing protein [Tanacetum coccineum]